jgi:cell division protein ZapB
LTALSGGSIVKFSHPKGQIGPVFIGVFRTMTTASIDTDKLTHLEQKVDELIRAVNKLSDENTALRTQQSNLIAERASLIEKTESARTRIEGMIARLKTMEART